VVSVVGGVVLAGLFSVVSGVVEMAFRYVRMVSGLLMIARLMVIGGVLVMFGGVFVVLSGFAVVLRGILGQGELSFFGAKCGVVACDSQEPYISLTGDCDGSIDTP
jgi:hypothetical protein